MDIDSRNRAELKSYFTKTSIPTQSNFAELIEAMLNQKEDGIAKIAGGPLSLEAVGDDSGSQKILSLYRKLSDAYPEWNIDLNLQVGTGETVFGLNVTDKDGNSLLFIDPSTGNVGINTGDTGIGSYLNAPKGKLSVENVKPGERGFEVGGAIGGSHIPYSDGRIFLTGYIGEENKGDFIFRTYDGSNYSHKLVVDGQTGIIEQENWHNIASNQFQNGWTNFGNGFNPAGYFKDSMGIVHLRGLVKGGARGHGKAIFTLPAGYRPPHQELHGTISHDNVGRADVAPDGKVTAVQGSASWFSLDGITFRATD